MFFYTELLGRTKNVISFMFLLLSRLFSIELICFQMQNWFPNEEDCWSLWISYFSIWKIDRKWEIPKAICIHDANMEKYAKHYGKIEFFSREADLALLNRRLPSHHRCNFLYVFDTSRSPLIKMICAYTQEDPIRIPFGSYSDPIMLLLGCQQVLT